MRPEVDREKGLSAASVEDIVESAGYTRGAFYSNFSSKDDLFLELLRRNHKERHVKLAALLDDSLPLDHIHAPVRSTARCTATAIRS
jgi:AcrR family transcriptional regulator